MAALEAEGNVVVAEALQQVINLLLQLSRFDFERFCAVGLLGQVSPFIPTADLTVAWSMVSLGHGENLEGWIGEGWHPSRFWAVALIFFRSQNGGGTVPAVQGVTVEDCLGDDVELLALGIVADSEDTFARFQSI